MNALYGTVGAALTAGCAIVVAGRFPSRRSGNAVADRAWMCVLLLAAACCGRAAFPIVLGLVPGLLVATVSDLSTGLIFNEAVLAIALPSGALAARAGRLDDALLGGLVCGGTLLGLNVISGGRGMGLGDVKLGAAIGVALGLDRGAVALGIACVAAAAAGVAIALRSQRRVRMLRFGPYLALGGIVSLWCWTL